jgi:hypothetical protein
MNCMIMIRQLENIFYNLLKTISFTKQFFVLKLFVLNMVCWNFEVH